jgi:isoquinoline 1-oxidoreductase beta subunit
MDVQVPGMRYGMILRAPVHGSRPESANDEVVLAQPGITNAVYLDHGIGIVGESVDSVMKAREQLNVSWSSDAPAEGFDSDTAFAAFSGIAAAAVESAATTPPGQGRGNVQTGDVPHALNSAAKTYRADYLSDHIYHAQMEPLNAVASVGQLPRYSGSRRNESPSISISWAAASADERSTTKQSKPQNFRGPPALPSN